MRIRSLGIAGLIVCGCFLSGCVARIGPGGAAPGIIRSNVTYPNLLNPNMQYRIVFDRDDIEILEPVSVEAHSDWYFLIWSTGDSGYSELMKRARAAGGEAVMNVTVDTNYKSFLIVFARVTTKLSGIAYRYKRDHERPQAAVAPDPDAAPSDAAAREHEARSLDEQAGGR